MLRLWAFPTRTTVRNDCEDKVYNPFAIGQTLGALKRRFVGTWIATGQTSAVINYFTNNQLAEKDYENVEDVSEEDLDVCGLEDIRPIAMLYQGGYLTIKDFQEGVFTVLSTPNSSKSSPRKRMTSIATPPAAP